MTFIANKYREGPNIVLKPEDLSSLPPPGDNPYYTSLQEQIMRGIEGKNEGIPIGHKILGSYANIRKNMYFLVGGFTGCLSGDTMIGINRKQATSNLKFYRLDVAYKKFHGLVKKDPWKLKLPTNTRSYKADKGCTGLNRILDIVYTGKKEVWEVTTSSGKKIKATKDHRFLVDDSIGEDVNIFKRLHELSVGDYVFVKSPKESRKRGRTATWRQEHTSKMPYYTIAKTRVVYGQTYQRVYKYRIVYDAYLNNISVKNFLREVKTNPNHNLIFSSPKDVIHHIDGNPLNNNISNLKLLKKKKHDSLHAKEFKSPHSYIHKERIVSIVSKGIEDTYDISCADPYHNFVANDFIVHNSGKTTFSHDSFILNPLDWYIKNYGKTKYKLNIIFRSMERSASYTLAKWLSRRIFLDHKIILPVNRILGWYGEKLSKDEHDLTTMYKDYFGFMKEVIQIHSDPINPIGAAKEAVAFMKERGRIENIDQYSKVYIPNNEFEITVVLTDHVGLFQATKELTQPKQLIDKWSSDCRYLRDFYGCCIINIQQFNRDISNPMRLKAGDVAPSLEDFSGSSNTQYDADLVLGLFDPGRYKVEALTKHNLGKLQSPDGSKRYRSLHILKSSYGADGVVIPLGMQPQVGLMKELPKSSNMTEDIYESILNNGYFYAL